MDKNQPSSFQRFKSIAFDLDGTLAISKGALDEEMRQLLTQLLEKKKVAIISGGSFNQFNRQIIQGICDAKPEQLRNLLLFPTCSTQCYAYQDKWNCLYSQELTTEQKTRIEKSLNKKIDEQLLIPQKSWGELIEDRGSQITYSALGQQAPIAEKEKWDPDQVKRRKLKAELDLELKEFEVRIGGTTSIDITLKGIDKAYGMQNIMKTLKITKEQILFVGDALYEGGNDYPVKKTGVETYQVSGPEETKELIRKMIG
jgi:hypothetical protein